MQVFELQGELRTDLGKKATNLLRAEGKVMLDIRRFPDDIPHRHTRI